MGISISGTPTPARNSIFSGRRVDEDLELERLWGVYPGKAAYPLTEKIRVLPLADVRDTWNYR
jgi:hypothetical protein